MERKEASPVVYTALGSRRVGPVPTALAQKKGQNINFGFHMLVSNRRIAYGHTITRHHATCS